MEAIHHQEKLVRCANAISQAIKEQNITDICVALENFQNSSEVLKKQLMQTHSTLLNCSFQSLLIVYKSHRKPKPTEC